MPKSIRPARGCPELLAFEEIRRRLRLGTRLSVGRREVPVADIIGTLERVDDFDGCFRPRTRRLTVLIKDLANGNPAAIDRPISLLQVDHAYFVEDGHKRLSLAIAAGRTFIDAEVDRYETPFHLARGATMDAVEATHRELRFRETTGLDVAAPEQRFILSNPTCYLELAESVKAHALDLSHSEERLVSREEGARHWYETVFRPVLALTREMSAARLLESTTDADRFLLFRRGSDEPMDMGWRIPKSVAERGRANLRDGTPGRWPALAGRSAGRLPRGRAEALEIETTAASSADRAPADAAAIAEPDAGVVATPEDATPEDAAPAPGRPD